VLRTAPIDFHGLRAVATIAAPSGDALLDDLVPGPDGDALLLWSEPASGAGATPVAGSGTIFAARGFDAYPGRTIFGAPEQVGPPGRSSEVSAAIDPASDRAIAVWSGERGLPEYSIRSVESVR